MGEVRVGCILSLVLIALNTAIELYIDIGNSLTCILNELSCATNCAYACMGAIT